MDKHQEKLKVIARRNKRIVTFSTLVGLVCPTMLGAVQVLANEAETVVPAAEQVVPETTQSSSEQTAPVVETPAPPADEKINEAEVEQPADATAEKQEEKTTSTPIIEEKPASISEEIQEKQVSEVVEMSNPAVVAEYRERLAYYQQEANGLITAGATEEQMTQINTFLANFSSYLSNYESGTGDNPEEWLRKIDSIDYDLYTEIRSVRSQIPGELTVTFNTRGNGSFSSYPTLYKVEGAWVSLADMPTPTAGADSHFKGWEVNGLPNGEMGSSNSYFTGFNVQKDTVVTAVFESGELNWADFDSQLAMFENYMELKDIYEYFGFMDEYDVLVSLYDSEVEFKTANFGSKTLSQRSLDLMSKGVTGTLLNFMDRVFFFDDNILSQIEDYHTSLVAVYEDTTSYTVESKKIFNEAYQALKEIINYTGASYHGEMERKYFTAYQNLLSAEDGLVEAPGSTLEELGIDTSVLKSLIAEVEAVVANPGLYTPESFANFVESDDYLGMNIHGFLEWGHLTLEHDGWTDAAYAQEQVDISIHYFNLALSKLVSINESSNNNVKDLEVAIKDAEAKLTETGYTPESVKALEESLKAAKAVLANPNSTQAEIDNALAAVKSAMNGLKKVDKKTNNNQSVTKVNNKSNKTNNSKNKLPKTGEEATTNPALAGVGLLFMTAIAWINKKRKAE